MSELALATWRLPNVRVDALEDAREASTFLDRDGCWRLSTCQRLILVALAGDEDPRGTAETLATEVGVPGAELRLGFDAFRHLARVTASLDAIVPGEDQIPGQVRSAVDAQAEDVPSQLHARLQRVLAVAKTARDEAGFSGQRSTSLADHALALIPADAAIAIVGTGTLAKAALRASAADRIDHLVSRSLERAEQRAPAGVRAWTRDRFARKPPAVDAVILCTRGKGEPVLTEEGVDALLAARQADEPLELLDLGVPRNADPSIGDRPDVELRTVEDLARSARRAGREDERIRRARSALEAALARERRQQAQRALDDRIVALRSDLAQELDALADELAELDPALAEDGELARWIDRAHGRLAHASQEHLVALARGERPSKGDAR